MQCGKHTCSGGCANNVNCMQSSAPGDTVSCSIFIRGMYTDIVVSHVHMN